MMTPSHMTSAFGTLLQNNFLEKARRVSQFRKNGLEKVSTREQALVYVEKVRTKIRKIFSLPTKKTPLNPVVVSTVFRRGFSIENVIYESRPAYPVTANLYLPDGTGKHPGVIFLCGHSQNGKNEEIYQKCCLELVLQGYAVLSIDPAGQGERYLFKNAPDSENIDGFCCNEHNMFGKQLQLAGEWFGAWRALDAVRGLDYLLTRPEIDASHIGITGNSGGGTMTTFVSALDDRFTMAAPGCYVTTWLHNIENELPADIEQIPPGILASGCEMADFLIAVAPRPVLILSQKDDFFDPRGAREAYRDARKIYALLGKEENVRLFIGPDPHGYTGPNRLSMCNFFNSLCGFPTIAELPVSVPGGEELLCTETGCLYDDSSVCTPHETLLKTVEKILSRRKENSETSLRTYFRKELRIPSGNPRPPYARELRPLQVGNTCFNRFALETEENMLAILKVKTKNDAFFALPDTRKARLFIPHLDGFDEQEKLFPGSPDCADMILDIRGIGELLPSGCDQFSREFFLPYLFDYHYASLGLMLDDPILGGKVRDILSALEYLKSNRYTEITLAANGQGCIPSALAGLFFKECRLEFYAAPRSWESMVRSRVTLWPQSCMLPGVLKKTDLPEIYAHLGGRLTIRGYSDAMFRCE